jgi:hypothetical protein
MSGWTQMPSHVRAALEHLGRKFGERGSTALDVSWAQRIVDRHARGEQVAAATLQIAREALRQHPIPPTTTEKRQWD